MTKTELYLKQNWLSLISWCGDPTLYNYHSIYANNRAFVANPNMTVHKAC